MDAHNPFDADPEAAVTSDPRVSMAWLARHIHDPGILVLDATLAPPGAQPAVDPHTRYRAAHVPGAIFFDIEQLSDHASSLPHMLPGAEQFSRAMEALGVDAGKTLVVYEQAGVFSAPRAWWMLRTFGAVNVHLLDGDLAAWEAAGLPLEAAEAGEAEAARRATARFPAAPVRAAVSDLTELKHTLMTGGQVVDARSAARFLGQAPEPRPGLPSGHMPGATSLPFGELVEAGRLKSAAALRQLFASRGVDLAQPVTTTCGSGVTAAVLTLGLTIAGATRLRLYDGAWAEYAQQPDTLIERDDR